MRNRDVFTAYLNAFTAGDLDTARQYIADDFDFQGPIVQATGKQAFFDNISPDLVAMTRGFELLRQFEQDDEVISIYEYQIETPAGQGAIFMMEWCTVKNGQLAASRLVFDSAQFAALMPG